MTRVAIAVVITVLAGFPLAGAAVVTLTGPLAIAVLAAPPARVDANSEATTSRSQPGRALDVGAVIIWAEAHVGDRYVMGANGPHTWDCSSFSRAAWAHAGVSLPRLAQDQRDWLAAGHGAKISYGQEQPGDLVYWNSYLGPDTVGHVALVRDPPRHTTIDARNPSLGVGHFSYHPDHHLFEIWRPQPAGDTP